MATNFIQYGKTLTMTAGSALSSGDVVEQGSFVGIAMTDADNGAEVEVCVEGVWAVAKVSAQAWTIGATIYWDSSGGKATTSSSGNTKMGYAAAAAANPSDNGRVKLWP